jgi:hypothetical protein
MLPLDRPGWFHMTRRHWSLLATSLLSGALLLPVTAYIAAGRIIGPYAGTRGLASYLGAIYLDASQGKPLALLILVAPTLCLGLWMLRGWMGRRHQPPREHA